MTWESHVNPWCGTRSKVKEATTWSKQNTVLDMFCLTGTSTSIHSPTLVFQYVVCLDRGNLEFSMHFGPFWSANQNELPSFWLKIGYDSRDNQYGISIITHFRAKIGPIVRVDFCDDENQNVPRLVLVLVFVAR